jgi:hypothetical protein
MQLDPRFEFYSNLVSIVISLALFVLKGVALYTMAKRRSFDKLWMAFVPFVNFILLGKLIGKVNIWGKEVKNLGLLVCITSAVSVVLGYAIDFGYYLYIIGQVYNVRFEFATKFMQEWASQTGLIWTIVYYVYLLIGIIDVILNCWIIFTIFRRYAPERSFMYSLIAIFFDFTFPILLFIVRNNEVMTFEDFLRTRNRYYNQNPNNYGGYNQGGNYYNNPTPPTNEVDPFPEFSNKPQNQNNGYTNENPYGTNNSQNTNSNEDDLFN